jgi:hypothetical protein
VTCGEDRSDGGAAVTAFRTPPSMNHGPPSDRKKSEPPACPECGQLLVDHALRSEIDEAGKPEMVKVPFCFSHAFFTWRASKGLRAGL